MTLDGWKQCRSCGAKIYWLKNEKTGKPAPIDKDPPADGGGNLEINVGKQAYRVAGKGSGRHTNHFMTCPSRDIWKRHGRTGMHGGAA